MSEVKTKECGVDDTSLNHSEVQQTEVIQSELPETSNLIRDLHSSENVISVESPQESKHDSPFFEQDQTSEVPGNSAERNLEHVDVNGAKESGERQVPKSESAEQLHAVEPAKRSQPDGSKVELAETNLRQESSRNANLERPDKIPSQDSERREHHKERGDDSLGDSREFANQDAPGLFDKIANKVGEIRAHWEHYQSVKAEARQYALDQTAWIRQDDDNFVGSAEEMRLLDDHMKDYMRENFDRKPTLRKS